MSKKGGLTSSVLGGHLGFDVPTVVRRAGNTALHSVDPTPSEQPQETQEAAPSKAAAPQPEAPEAGGEVAAQGRAAEEGRVALNAGEEPITGTRKSLPAPPAPHERSSVEANELADDPPEDSPEPKLDEADTATRRAPAASRRRPTAPVPSKAEGRSSVYRVGTQRAPYERADGTKTEKVGFTAPHGFKEEINLFCLSNRLGPASDWIVAALRREMERAHRGKG